MIYVEMGLGGSFKFEVGPNGTMMYTDGVRFWLKERSKVSKDFFGALT